MSVLYHIGFDICVGMAPVISAYLIAKANEGHRPYYYLEGLNYAIILMSISLVIGILYLRENNEEQVSRIKNPAKKNRLKRILGLVWILLGLIAAYWGIVKLGFPKIGSGKPDDLIFGIIVLFIVTPVITIGLFAFGKYALPGNMMIRGDLRISKWLNKKLYPFCYCATTRMNLICALAAPLLHRPAFLSGSLVNSQHFCIS